MGVSREMGSWAILMILRTLVTGMSIFFAISSLVGSRPISWTRARETRMSLLIVSIMGTRGGVGDLGAAVAVLLGDGDDEPEVGRDELLLSLVADLLPGRDRPDHPPQGLRVEPDLRGLLLEFPVYIPDLLLEDGIVLFLLGQGRRPVVARVLEVVDGPQPGAELVDDPLPVGRAEVEVAG